MDMSGDRAPRVASTANVKSSNADYILSNFRVFGPDRALEASNRAVAVSWHPLPYPAM